MNLQEAAYWVDGLFPGDVVIEKFGDFHLASFEDSGQYMVSTLDFQAVDTGLETDGCDVRVELFVVAEHEDGLKELVVATAEMLRDTSIIPQPGEVAPGAGAVVKGLSARHSLLVVPFPWGGDVPRFQDDAAITLMLQILPLTDPELEYLATYGLADLQKALVEQQVNVFDLKR